MLTALLLLFGFSCTGLSEPTSPADELPILDDDTEPYGDLARFLPLKNHSVFSYDTLDEESGETGLLVIQIQHLQTGLVEVTVGGRKEWLEPTETAVRHSSGGALLRTPLTVGSTWKGPNGVMKLRTVGQRVDVPAGTFSNCIETEENSSMGESSQQVITSYCPDVGITRMEIESTISNTYRHEVAELAAWGPMLDWGKDGITITK